MHKKEITHKSQNAIVYTGAVMWSNTKQKFYFPTSVFQMFVTMMQQPSCVRNPFCALSLFQQCMIILCNIPVMDAKLVGALPPVRVNTHSMTLLCKGEDCVFR